MFDDSESQSKWWIMKSIKNNLSVFPSVFVSLLFFLLDHQKLEREARICRLLKHPNIGEYYWMYYMYCRYYYFFCITTTPTITTSSSSASTTTDTYTTVVLLFIVLLLYWYYCYLTAQFYNFLLWLWGKNLSVCSSEVSVYMRIKVQYRSDKCSQEVCLLCLESRCI